MKKGTLLKLLGILLCIAMLTTFAAGCSEKTGDTSTAESSSSQEVTDANVDETSAGDYGQFDDAYVEDEHNIPDATGEIWSTSNRTATMSSCQWPEVMKNIGMVYNPDGTYDLPISTTHEQIEIWIGLSSLNTAVTNYDENETYQYVEEITGIDAVYIHPTYGQEATEFGILLASGDWPDITRWGYGDTSNENYLNDGIYYDMQYMIRDWMPNYRWRIRELGMERDAGSDSGRIGIMYYLEDPQELPWSGLLVRTDMMNTVGITNYPETVDDWEVLLQAFQDHYGEGYGTVNAGVSFLLRNSEWISAWDIGWDFYVDGNDTVGYGCYTPQYKEFCLRMRDWYNKGYIDKDFASRPDGIGAITIEEVAEYKISTIYGAFGGARGQTVTRYPGQVPDDMWYEPVVAPVMNKGDTQHFRNVSSPLYNSSVVMGDCDRPVLVAKYYDWLYSDDGAMILSYGEYGKHWIVNKNGVPDGTDYAKVPPNNIDITIWKYRIQAGWWYIGVLANDWWGFVNAANFDREVLENTDMSWYYSGEVWALAEGDYVYPRFSSMTGEESEEYSTRYTDIDTYVKEMTPQFIMGILDIETEWDKYISTLEQMGIKDCIACKQAAFDRYSLR